MGNDLTDRAGLGEVDTDRIADEEEREFRESEASCSSASATGTPHHPEPPGDVETLEALPHDVHRARHAALEPTRELTVPALGLVVRLDDLEEVAQAQTTVRELQDALRTCRDVLDHAVVEQAERLGTKTLTTAAGAKIKLTGGPGSVLSWDLEVLAELLEAGLPQERYNDLVRETVEYKVDARVAKQLRGANPKYAAIIDRAEQRDDAKWSVGKPS